MEALAPYLMALLPTIGVGALFYFVMKAIIEADRRERVAQATWEHDHESPSARPSSPADRGAANGEQPGAADGVGSSPTGRAESPDRPFA